VTYHATGCTEWR